MDLHGAVAAVTGGASGIGRACAISLAKAGCDVVVADIDASRMDEVAARITDVGRAVRTLRVDVTNRDEVEALVDEAVAWKGHCDVFVSNAGAGMHGPPHKTPVADYEWAIDVNVRPHVWATHRLLPHLLERGSGHLVHVASAAGLVGSAYFAAYCMSKFAVVGLAESLAVYTAGTGVNVSVVCPMLVNTNLGERTHMAFEVPVDDAVIDRLRVEYKAALERDGIAPERVGDAVVDAVQQERFWVFPHAEVADQLAAKWRDPEHWIDEQRATWRAQTAVLEETQP